MIGHLWAGKEEKSGHLLATGAMKVACVWRAVG